MATLDPSFDLGARVDRLERRNRILGAAVAALLLLLVLPAFAARDDGELRAKRFVLVDGQDKTIGAWQSDEHGLPRFELFDGSKKARLTAQVTPDDMVFALRDREGLVRCGIALGVGGLPHLLLSDSKGRPRIHFSVNVVDRGNLIMFGPEGDIVAGLGVEDDGDGWLRPLPAGTGTPVVAPDAAQRSDGKEPPPKPPEETPPPAGTGTGTRRNL